MGKLTISMVIFNSYVTNTRGYDLWSFIVWVSWKSSFHFLCCHGPWAASLHRRQAIFDYVHVGGVGPEIRTTSGNSNLATKPWLLAMLPHWKHHLRATPHYHLDNPCSFNPLEKIRIFPPTIFDCQEQGSIDKSNMNQVSSTYQLTNSWQKNIWILLDSILWMTSGQLYLVGSVKNIELMAQVWWKIP